MILLRHGQSEFNLHYSATLRDPGITDPKLTPLGHEQAASAADALAAGIPPIRRIIASPYTRALQTAAPLALRLGLPVEVDPRVRERYAFSCDVGSPCATLTRTWPEHDFSAIDEIWWPEDEEKEAETIARANRFRAVMAGDPTWRETVLVSHWGFILSMTGRSIGNGEWLRLDPTLPPPARIVWRV